MFEKVAQILADYKDLDVSTITPESTLADLGIDSLDTAELIMNMEDEFGVTIKMDQPVADVQGIVKLIEANVQ